MPVPGDYDGDGSADRAVFRSRAVSGSFDGAPVTQFGTFGDVPVPGDYDGHGRTGLAVFRPSIGVWFVHGGNVSAFGTAGDIPVPGGLRRGRCH